MAQQKPDRVQLVVRITSGLKAQMARVRRSTGKSYNEQISTMLTRSFGRRKTAA